MRILFVANATEDEVRTGAIRMASLRYRAAMPVAELQRRGCEAALEHVGAALHPSYQTDADVVVLAQPKENILTSPGFLPGYLGFIQRQKALGRRILMDVCDLKLGEAYLAYIASLHNPSIAALCRQFYPAILRSADLVITPTDALAGRLQISLGPQLACTVIPDPIEVQRRPVRFDPAAGAPLRLLWFGFFGSHAAPVGAFCRGDLKALAGERSVTLHLLAEEAAAGPVARLAMDSLPAQVSFAPWSLQALDAALEICDAAVMPIDYQTESAVGKSNNRALQALYAGRPVFAQPIASYLELKNFCFVGADLGAGLRTALADPDACRERTAAGQAHVAETYSIAAIGRRWTELLERLSR